MDVKKEKYYNEEYDSHNCDREPLQRIRRSQSYGSFLACNTTGTEWYYASFHIVEDLKTNSISEIILRRTGIDFHQIDPTTDEIQFHSNPSYEESLIIHTKDFGYIFEIEPTEKEAKINLRKNPYKDLIMKLSKPMNQIDMMNEIIHQVYTTTGYDHVMIYRFEDDKTGEVIAEKKIEESPSYLGIKFPATDIPEQARKLYFKEKIRIIHDATSDGNLIIANETERSVELDLTGVSMRGVSPIHREYLCNMGVQSSFSVAIIIDDKLWGLIACHNKKPKFVNYDTRVWLQFISGLISINWEKVVKNEFYNTEIKNLLIQSHLMENILTSQDLMEGLLYGEDNIMGLIRSDSVLIKSKDDIKGIGDLPEPSIINGINEWLNSSDKMDIRVISKSKDILPPELYSPLIAGMLIMQLSEISGDYIIWMRKEKSTDIVWGGNPELTKKFDPIKGRLTPRKSFEGWKETVKDMAEPWSDSDIQIAKNLKRALIDQLYKKYNEVVMLNNELNEAYKELESFSYTVSHDLKAPLRSIEGFSRILREDYADVLDEQGLHLLNTISESISKMKSFIHEILNYSKLSKGNLNVTEVNVNSCIDDLTRTLKASSDSEPIIIVEKHIPYVYGDANMLNQLFQNLLTNSIKYVPKGVQPEIRISHKIAEKHIIIALDDNGIGIPIESRERVFDVFRRLVTDDEYEGTGVGLSTVKKVVDKHGGEVKIHDGTIADTGTRFEISLPSTSDFMDIINKRN